MEKSIEYEVIQLVNHRIHTDTNRKLGEKTVSNIASKSNPVPLTNNIEGYRNNGFWWYRNSNPNAGAFARIWMKVIDTAFQERLDILLEWKNNNK